MVENLKEKIVVLGADHNGVGLKRKVKQRLEQKGYYCVDIGPYSDIQKVDYVDYARTVGNIIENKDARWGVLICGTGVGLSIVVNRFSAVRASLVHVPFVAPKTREHNDANVLCLGAWVNSDEENIALLDQWFGESFGEGRHVPRVEKTKKHNSDKIVFTNGVFDLLHPGHVKLLQFAKSLGGKLIVAINSDRAVKVLKGNSRPIHTQDERKMILEKLDCVDEVVIFDDTKTEEVVRAIHPDVLVKGGEWNAETVRSRDLVPEDIEIKIFPLVKDEFGEKLSTSEIINKIQNSKT